MSPSDRTCASVRSCHDISDSLRDLWIALSFAEDPKPQHSLNPVESLDGWKPRCSMPGYHDLKIERQKKPGARAEPLRCACHSCPTLEDRVVSSFDCLY